MRGQRFFVILHCEKKSQNVENNVEIQFNQTPQLRKDNYPVPLNLSDQFFILQLNSTVQ